MMLDEIGFYTLSDKRARDVALNPFATDLQRCELILTDACNFRCPYCRGIQEQFRGTMHLEKAKKVVDIWVAGNCHNIRLSGGEPTVVGYLPDLVKYIRQHKCFDNIALSTNGSADFDLYKYLSKLGVSDFSISLDACCSSTGDTMSGTSGYYRKIISNIKKLSDFSYVTLGIVLEQQNEQELDEIIKFGTSLGVADIRIIPSAQYNQPLHPNIENTKFPILKYRLQHIKEGRHVRGLNSSNSCNCHLVKDDMAVLADYHYPCIIYMREQGDPIGKIDFDLSPSESLKRIMKEREYWFKYHYILNNPICSKNCLDVCTDYNDEVEKYSFNDRICLK
jgi:MoaA/NifB/PqqE/SkfB family radical SAM enzyme